MANTEKLKDLASGRSGESRPSERKYVESNRKRDATGSGRVRLGKLNLKLNVRDYGGQLEGFRERWVSDHPGRIQWFLDRGYTPVFREGVRIGDGSEDSNSDMGSWVSRVVDRIHGKPILGYLLKIKEEWAQEDEQDEQSACDELMHSIMGKNFHMQFPHSSAMGGYVKKASFNIGAQN